LDLSKVTQSAIPAWRHPAIWSTALFFASWDFGPTFHMRRGAIAPALRWIAAGFVILYVIMVVGYWAFTPSPWEDEA
jgi:hypothetical protein